MNWQGILLMAVTSLDGKIAKSDNLPVLFNSKEDKQVLKTQIELADYLIIGRKTYFLSEKILKKRPCFILSQEAFKYQDSTNIKYLSFNQLLEYIKQFPNKRYLLLGGRQIYSLFLEKKLVKQMLITLEPIILGSGISLFENINIALNFKLIQLKQINSNGTLIISYLSNTI